MLTHQQVYKEDRRPDRSDKIRNVWERRSIDKDQHAPVSEKW